MYVPVEALAGAGAGSVASAAGEAAAAAGRGILILENPRRQSILFGRGRERERV